MDLVAVMISNDSSSAGHMARPFIPHGLRRCCGGLLHGLHLLGATEPQLMKIAGLMQPFSHPNSSQLQDNYILYI
jgi:hypothetical protein